MSHKKISELTAATTPLAGTEEVPVVQGGVTKRVSAANIGSTTLGGLTDVDTSGAAAGAALTYDGAGWEPDGSAASHISSTANPHTVTAAQAGAMAVVVHGATAGTARPGGVNAVYWKGSVEPTNGENGDLWYDTLGD